MYILGIFSHKGGVGKSTTAVNLAYLAAKDGQRTLLCDLDAQSASSYYLKMQSASRLNARQFAKGGDALEASIQITPYPNLDLLPGNLSHREMDIVLDGLKHSRTRLRRVFEPLSNRYDLVIVDSPPTLNLLAENIFRASDALLCPLIPSPLSLRAHQQLLGFLHSISYQTDQVYVFLNLVDKRKKIHREIGLWIYQNIENTLQVSIAYLSDVERMGLERRPIFEYAPNSNASTAYRDLWQEIHKSILKTV